jgi:hypothetical protein
MPGVDEGLVVARCHLPLSRACLPYRRFSPAKPARQVDHRGRATWPEHGVCDLRHRRTLGGRRTAEPRHAQRHEAVLLPMSVISGSAPVVAVLGRRTGPAGHVPGIRAVSGCPRSPRTLHTPRPVLAIIRGVQGYPGCCGCAPGSRRLAGTGCRAANLWGSSGLHHTPYSDPPLDPPI